MAFAYLLLFQKNKTLAAKLQGASEMQEFYVILFQVDRKINLDFPSYVVLLCRQGWTNHWKAKIISISQTFTLF